MRPHLGLNTCLSNSITIQILGGKRQIPGFFYDVFEYKHCSCTLINSFALLYISKFQIYIFQRTCKSQLLITFDKHKCLKTLFHRTIHRRVTSVNVKMQKYF